MKNITIIGSGYVGLVTGAGLSEFGNHVICADIDQNKILKLNSGNIPIYEPGLKEIIDRNVKGERLYFSSEIAKAINLSDVIIIGVGTPQTDDGSTDMQYVNSVLNTIKKNLKSYKVICTKALFLLGLVKKLQIS